MKKKKPTYHSIIVSDVHLGTRDAKAEQLTRFLKASRCRKLILNGDIVDGWALKSGGKWADAHTKLVRTILKKMEKDGTEVIYLRGNHDDILEKFLPLAFGRFSIEQEYVHETPRGNYLVVHGDGFDSVTTRCRFLALLGSYGYALLLRVNRLYNAWRSWRGQEYFSLSREIKARVKSAVSFVDRFEDQLRHFAQARGCAGIICGHIHTAADKMIGEIHYLNSGDWVESLTAIIEPQPGEFQVVSYQSMFGAADPAPRALPANADRPRERNETPVAA